MHHSNLQLQQFGIIMETEPLDTLIENTLLSFFVREMTAQVLCNESVDFFNSLSHSTHANR